MREVGGPSLKLNELSNQELLDMHKLLRQVFTDAAADYKKLAGGPSGIGDPREVQVLNATLRNSVASAATALLSIETEAKHRLMTNASR